MSELQKEINDAYIALSTIPVFGSQVEIMAAVREHLRSAFKLAGPESREAESSG